MSFKCNLTKNIQYCASKIIYYKNKHNVGVVHLTSYLSLNKPTNIFNMNV